MSNYYSASAQPAEPAAAGTAASSSSFANAIAAAQAAAAPAGGKSALSLNESMLKLAMEVTTPAQQSKADAFDFFNNWGTAFMNTLNEKGTRAIWEEMVKDDANQQSGSSARSSSVAQKLWTSIDKTCEELFDGYRPISAAAHACDLITHAATVTHLCGLNYNDRNRYRSSNSTTLDGALVDPEPIGILSLNKTYFTMGFVAQTLAIHQGLFMDIRVSKKDPSIEVNDPQVSALVESSAAQLKAEDESIVQIEELIERGKKDGQMMVRMFVIEPLLVPGGGRYYTRRFLLMLQKTCRKHGVILVADETLSFVRCGYPLMSMARRDGFRPDLVFTGKGLGCSLMLGDMRNLIGAADSRAMLLDAFSIISPAGGLLQTASVLRAMLDMRVADHCRVEGARMVAAFNEIDGVKARGQGFCLWVEHYDQLPILGTLANRLLPRYDQTAAGIRELYINQKRIMHALKQSSTLESHRLHFCSLCGDKQREDVLLYGCSDCIRVYHRACRTDQGQRWVRGPCTPTRSGRAGAVDPCSGRLEALPIKENEAVAACAEATKRLEVKGMNPRAAIVRTSKLEKIADHKEVLAKAAEAAGKKAVAEANAQRRDRIRERKERNNNDRHDQEKEIELGSESDDEDEDDEDEDEDEEDEEEDEEDEEEEEEEDAPKAKKSKYRDTRGTGARAQPEMAISRRFRQKAVIR